jgi:energy-coupling factor transport system substrate-specific component
VSRQLIAMLIGVALYGAVYYFIIALFLQQKDIASDILYGLGIVIPLFFGVIFGPLAGLVTALGGFLLGHVLTGATPAWNNALAVGLTGLLAGLAALRTRRRRGPLSSFGTALACAVPALLIGEAFADCSSIYAQRVSVAGASFNFLIFSLLELVGGVILLPLALAIYYGVSKLRGRPSVP